MYNDDFEETARMLGHDLELLRNGEEVKSTLKMNSIDEFKEFIIKECTPPGYEDKQSLLDICALFPDFLGDTSGGGALHRLEAYIYNDVSLSKEHRDSIESAFPIAIDAVSMVNPPPITAAGKTIGPGLGPQFYNWGTLTMEPGAFISIYGVNIVNMKIETLIRNGDQGVTGSTKSYDIGVLGVTGGVGGQGPTGSTGGVGNAGKSGRADAGGVSVKPTIGNTGGTGGIGSPGNPGKHPVASSPATFTIGTLTGSQPFINIITRSGTGGNGGKGGTGGLGGPGGTGGNAGHWDCYVTNSANGGPGGRGGTGGDGGKGSDGVDGSNNIKVFISADQLNKIIPQSLPAPGGQPGLPGDPGPGGGGGNPGTPAAGKSNSKSGVKGGKGSGGNPGKSGPTGSKSGTSFNIKVQAPI